VALLDNAYPLRGLDGPPNPPTLGRAPAQPWRSSTTHNGLQASTGLSKTLIIANARIEYDVQQIDAKLMNTIDDATKSVTPWTTGRSRA